MSEPDDIIQNVPDGGFGWLLVAGVVLMNMFTQSIVSNFSLLFGDHLQQMNQKVYGAALLASLNSIFLNFSGFLIGPAIKIFKPRKVAIIGCLLVSFGLILCSLSYKLWHMILGYSILIGIGLGLIGPSTFIAINSCFLKKRGFAVGIALAGTGIGQIILPQIIHLLLQNYGYKSTVFIISGLTLNGLIGACLFRPMEKYIDNNNKQQQQQQQQKNIKEIKLLLDLNDDDDKKHRNHDHELMNDKMIKNEKSVTLLSVKSTTPIIVSSSSSSSNKNDKYKNKLFKEILLKITQSMDLQLLKDPIFCNIIFGIGLVYTVSINFSMLFPYFLQFSIGVTKSDTALCMSILAGTDTFCRLLLPILTDKFKLSYRFVFLLGSIGLLINRFIFIQINNNNDDRNLTIILLYIISALYGCTKSATILNNNLTISEHLKIQDKLPGGLGLNMISKGILVISLGQLLGWLRDYTKSYIICLNAQNLLVTIVIVLWIFEFIFKYAKNYLKINRINNTNNNVEI